ncbi:MAG: hypothetical protein ACXVNF_00835 [Neobacillus sp.]
MGVRPQVKSALFLVWILMVPGGMWLTYNAFSHQTPAIGWTWITHILQVVDDNEHT